MSPATKLSNALTIAICMENVSMERVSAMMGSTARHARKVSDHAVRKTAVVTANASTTSALVTWFVDHVSACG